MPSGMHLDIKREVSQWLTSRSFYTRRAALARGTESKERKGKASREEGMSRAGKG